MTKRAVDAARSAADIAAGDSLARVNVLLGSVTLRMPLTVAMAGAVPITARAAWFARHFQFILARAQAQDRARRTQAQIQDLSLLMQNLKI